MKSKLILGFLIAATFIVILSTCGCSVTKAPQQIEFVTIELTAIDTVFRYVPDDGLQQLCLTWSVIGERSSMQYQSYSSIRSKFILGTKAVVFIKR